MFYICFVPQALTTVTQPHKQGTKTVKKGTKRAAVMARQPRSQWNKAANSD
jgi:hypothetical protein